MPAVPLVMAEFVDPSEAVAPRPSSATPARQPSRPEFGVDDEPLVALPSFDELAALRGPALPPINAGKAAYSLPEEEEQSPVEKVVFRLAWAGIGTLIAIEAEGRARNTLLEPARDLLKARERGAEAT
ncbi:hypothetical protein EMIHUDRAFT_203981 [Emiliania huxleyi CCMP1516]|uniref:Uncharacterized protein n=2 Tax=Emiliania huxleyi TaxID=2903 RepID=A0A0D3K0R5_EMIH1|nr:hypothetical protein EMIHUDRAFT_203981 [Emiliania huxleyi CCMP1516]EOD29350.1 hypothetical protein EMIHUDRAFT_203981 [Emiliania huxleyi CCMP1516]|eukprot:XP_005781779.1 hypothetical protein EMIHUDRAFT_203981 [Emiliania huxleyi CCMP1516]